MKKLFKILGITFGILAALIALIAAWVQLTPLPTYEVKPPQVTIPTDSTTLERGKKVAELVCAHCHLGEDGKMSGRLFTQASDPFGEMWAANITQHPTKGIGRYTDGELAYLVRTGINRDGRVVGYMMCHPQMSDEDLGAVIAYLRSDAPMMQATEKEYPAPAYLNSFMVKALLKFGIFKPLPYDGQPILAPPMSDQVAYGRYLATDLFECSTCHSASFETLDMITPENSPNFMGGGNPVPDEDFNIVISANITPSKEHGIGNWTKEQFVTAVRTGLRPDGRILKPNMPRFAVLSDAEMDAIWAYIQTVPTIDVPVVATASK
ncbi:MAG: c-type cytochrome [Saprospiraceae bacterium]|nr:c-type cytochrome [Saprospiraceae bacterium]